MKKHKLVAVVGTLALTANLLLPGLVFGQAPQQGDLSVACSGASPTFSETPAATFDFTTDGVSGAITSSNTKVETYSDDNGNVLGFNIVSPAAANNGAEDRYIEAQDVRDYNGDSDPLNPPDPDECGNNGLHIDLAVINNPLDATAEGPTGSNTPIYFDSNPSADGGDYIPLTGVYVVSDATATSCPAGSTVTNGLCFRTSLSTTCQDSANCSATASAATYDVTTTNFATPETFTTALGSAANTPVTRTLVSVPDGSAVYGKVGTGTAFRADVPAFQPNGTYQLNLQYDVIAN